MFACLLTLSALISDPAGTALVARIVPTAVAVQAGAAAARTPVRAAPSTARASAPALPRATFIVNMDAEFRKMDADKNGLVSTTEIENFQRAVAAGEAQTRSRALFNELDRDRNGALSQVEFAAMQGLTPRADAGPMLQRFDANRDRSISLVEHRAATLRNFDRLDTDMDGLVTAAEMQAAGAAR